MKNKNMRHAQPPTPHHHHEGSPSSNPVADVPLLHCDFHTNTSTQHILKYPLVEETLYFYFINQFFFYQNTFFGEKKNIYDTIKNIIRPSGISRIRPGMKKRRATIFYSYAVCMLLMQRVM